MVFCTFMYSKISSLPGILHIYPPEDITSVLSAWYLDSTLVIENRLTPIIALTSGNLYIRRRGSYPLLKKSYLPIFFFISLLILRFLGCIILSLFLIKSSIYPVIFQKLGMISSFGNTPIIQNQNIITKFAAAHPVRNIDCSFPFLPVFFHHHNKQFSF